MSAEEIVISDAFKEQVWLVAFDMDQTSLDIHTSGVVVKDNETLPPIYNSMMFKPRKGKEVLDHVKESIKLIIPTLLKSGIAVAICTNTDVNMVSHSSLMGGRELVEYIFGNTFDAYPNICDHLIIEAWRGTLDAVRVSAWNVFHCRAAERTTIWHACGNVWTPSIVTMPLRVSRRSSLGSAPSPETTSRRCPPLTR